MSSIRPLFDIYSTSLLTAMILAISALGVTLAHAVGGGRYLLAKAGSLCLLAFGFAVFALTFPVRVGHPEGSAAALSPLAFLLAHRAMALVVLLTAGLAVAARRVASSD